MKTKLTIAVLVFAFAIFATASAGEKETDRAGRYIGASNVQTAGCLTGGSDPDEPLYGIVVGCTHHDLQKYGSMGRQIRTDWIFGEIEFTWTNKKTSVLGAGMNVAYSSSACGIGGCFLSEVAVAGPATDPNERSGFPTVTNVGDGTQLNAHQWNRVATADSLAYRPYVFKNETPGLPDFFGFGGVSGLGMVPDSAWDGFLVGDAQTFIWPQIAYTDQSGTQVAHLVISSDRSDGDNTALYLRRVGSADWETVMELGPAAYQRSFIVTNSPNSERVAIAFSGGRGDGTASGAPVARYNSEESGKHDNDLYVILSEDAGATWGPLQNITKRADDTPGGFVPHAKLSAVFDESDVYHLIWQATPWAGYGGGFTTAARMYHWDDVSQTTRIAADGVWTPSDCEPGFQQLNIDNPQLSYCGNKLYLTYTMFASVPLGMGDDCHTRAYSGDPVGAANGTIYVTVSDNSGFNWDAPRALLDKYTPDCDTLDGTPNPDCVSAAWHSSSRIGLDVTWGNYLAFPDFTSRLGVDWPTDVGDYIFMQYIHDHSPGAAPLGRGGWTDNPVRSFRFACVDKVSSARIASSLPQGVVLRDSIDVGSADLSLNWILENIGDQNISDLTVSVIQSEPAGFASVTGFGTSLQAGSDNADTGSVQLALSALTVGDSGVATIVVSGSFDESPMTFEYRFDTFIPCCVVPGDANRDGIVSIGDVVCMITGIFSDGICSPPFSPCPEVLDANGSGSFSIGDVTHLLAYIFSGGPAPVCGVANVASGQ